MTSVIPGVPLKYLAKIIAGQSPASEDVSDLGVGRPFLQGNAEFGSRSPSARYECEVAPKRAEPGDLLLSVRAPVGALNLADQAYGIGRGLAAIRSAGAPGRFIWWWLHHVRPELDSVATGSTFQAVSASQIGVLRVPQIPAKMMQRIAEFLDRETAEIDAVIAKQEELIRLLGERRSAVIAHAVTKGLNPDAPMKDSGVEWLGEVPNHWTVTRLKFGITHSESGTSVNGSSEPAAPGEIGVLKTGAVSFGFFDASQNKAVIPEDVSRVSCPVREGALVVNRANTADRVGAAGVVNQRETNLYLSDKLWQLTFDPEVATVAFIHLWTQTAQYRNQVQARCVGASHSMQNLSFVDFKNVYMAIPDVQLQTALVGAVHRDLAEIECVTTKAREAIELMRERRAALISGAVTGRLDIETYGKVEGSA